MTKAKISVPWRRRPLVRFSPPPSGPLPSDWIDVGLRPTDSEPTYSDADIVQTIAEELNFCLPVKSLPLQFAQTQYRLECYMCGRATEYLDWIIGGYPGLGFSIKDDVLKFEFRGGGTAKQLQRARIMEVVGSVPPASIVKELTKQKIRLLDFVGPMWRKRLESHDPPINTWPEAMKSRKVGDMSELRHYIQQRASNLRKECREKAAKAANSLLLDRPFEVEVSDEEWAEKRRRRDAATRGFIAIREAQIGHH
jgi:hypothetical protein